jgi:hypothetical protein
VGTRSSVAVAASRNERLHSTEIGCTHDGNAKRQSKTAGGVTTTYVADANYKMDRLAGGRSSIMTITTMLATAQSGAARGTNVQVGTSAPRRRPQLVDLNFVPLEFRPRRFPFLTAGLALSLVGGILLLFGLAYLSGSANLEVARLTKQVEQSRAVVSAASGNAASANLETRPKTLAWSYALV